MISIGIHDVPKYLRGGNFYESLLSQSEESFDIPVAVLKLEPTVNSEPDLKRLLSSLRFWVVSAVPEELIRYSQAESNRAVVEAACAEYCVELSYLPVLLAIARKEEEQIKLDTAAGSANPDVFHYFRNEYTCLNTNQAVARLCSTSTSWAARGPSE